ncbi:malate synthase A [Nafulsella turpanensis]|uniref:malate synthase A n=1 Tax=Nafulsella turpanensis TaxID=1265690 RepID=UPI000346ABD1|nr:malate synthase A [Nafulsella turpanensis]
MPTATDTAPAIEVKAKPYEKLLTPEALQFLLHLHRKFNAERKQLLRQRKELQQKLDEGQLLNFREDTRSIRESDYTVAPIPEDLQDRRVEITGPVDRKMVINALNSGAKVFMADFEDASAPTWQNMMEGQQNLYDAIRRQVDFTAPNGKTYALKKETATLTVRPRGWHLEEKHVLVGEGGTAQEQISASLFDFGLFFFHNAAELLKRGSGPYFYLPKLESYEEAVLWNKVFVEAQDYLRIPQGSVKATVLIETIGAAFQMDEIIYALSNHMAGLNAGRWDYIFSLIKKFRKHKDFILPDRVQVGMSAPFMGAYAELLVKTCHKRGAHAIGGMSAFIPAKEEEVNQRAFEKVKKDKELEASRGYDGTWVAHPFLVDTAAEQISSRFSEGKTHQKDKRFEQVQVSQQDLLNTRIEGGKVTEAGLRTNINVGILYIEHWLGGTGAAALYNLMEDAATAEISRAQVWQWYHQGVKLDSGQLVSKDLIEAVIEEELQKIKIMLGKERFENGHFAEGKQLFRELVLSDEFEEFLTLKAYELLE